MTPTADSTTSGATAPLASTTPAESAAAGDSRTYAGFPLDPSIAPDQSKSPTPPRVTRRARPTPPPPSSSVAGATTNHFRRVAVLGTVVLGGIVASVMVLDAARGSSESVSDAEQVTPTAPLVVDQPVASSAGDDRVQATPASNPAAPDPVASEDLVQREATVDSVTEDPETVGSAAVDPEPDPSVPSPEPDTGTQDTGVQDSVGVVRNGQIFLSGAVPSLEAGQRIADLAAQIIGPDNVINNYVVDPRATDPNLGNLTVEDTINFGTDSAVILPGSETLLNQGLALMTVRPAMTVTIVGHTDSRGTEARNMELSLARAEAVKLWFVERGIDANRFTVVGAGASEPIGDNATAEGRRVNRRIQFLLENLLAEG